MSAGLGRASGGSAEPASSGNHDHRFHERAEETACYDPERRPVRCELDAGGGGTSGVASRGGTGVLTTSRARLEGYVGAQKVLDSDGAFSAEVAVTDWRLRAIAGVSQYFETIPGGDRLTMTMPSLMLGVRIDDLGSTRVILEGGVVHISTQDDPMEDSSFTGAIAGLTVEHPLSKQLSLFGNVHNLWFDDDVRARAGRVGVGYGHVQAAVRVLDFNVGPALWGPALGVRF
ncbi:MAG: hypothetical protein H0X17_18350 [Deltaproteobacteria bacterium]|nr:hypothetical protein [Deltaproteobacteria bacterium]